MDTMLSWIDQHSDELLAMYKKLHAIPELGFQEFKTSAILAEELRKAGYEVQDKVAGTGIIGTLKGKDPGLTFALRADMDALPMEEKTGLPYASTHPGTMHACGHDSHSAMLLFAAKAIAANGGIKRGALKILFQPGEEGYGGARAMIESGILKGVDEMVGIHMRNNNEARVGEAVPAVYHSASCKVQATIHGKAAHSAWLHRGVNVIEALAAVVNASCAIHADPTVTHSVKVTRCSAGGKAANIIPDLAELTFDLRSQTNEVMADLQAKVENAVLAGSATVGAKGEVVILRSSPAADHDKALIADTAASIAAILGPDKCLPPTITPGSEDFHCYSTIAGIKTAFIGLGGDMGTGGHTPTMCLDLSALPNGAKIMAHLVRAKLG